MSISVPHLSPRRFDPAQVSPPAPCHSCLLSSRFSFFTSPEILAGSGALVIKNRSVCCELAQGVAQSGLEPEPGRVLGKGCGLVLVWRMGQDAIQIRERY